MNELNEADLSSIPADLVNRSKTEEKSCGNEEAKETCQTDGEIEGREEKIALAGKNKKDILKFTMLFNKYSSVLSMKKRNDEDKRDNKYAMFFNKEVTIRRNTEVPSTMKINETKNGGSLILNPRRSAPIRVNRIKSKFHPHYYPTTEPQISEPAMMFSSSLSASFPEVFERKTLPKPENLKKFLNKRNPKVEPDSLVQLNVHPATQRDLRNHNSLTSLPKNNKLALKGALRSKIPSLTALDSNLPGTGSTRFGYWDHWDDLILMQSDVEKRLNLQISRSSNDNNRRSVLKFKKEEPTSVSDSKLLLADSEAKKHIKKCDKKSRGDSLRKERDNRSRKQVQWKDEVDVIYFSTDLAANGDRMGEIVERVMEPLREEWEQQRKGFYAKLVPSHMESHMKDRFISLLKM